MTNRRKRGAGQASLSFSQIQAEIIAERKDHLLSQRERERERERESLRQAKIKSQYTVVVDVLFKWLNNESLTTSS